MSNRRDKRSGKKRVAIVGSQGVPPKYGGFETLVDNILAYRSEDVEYTVFCSAPDMDTSISQYKGAKLKYIPLRAHGIMSVPYDIMSLGKAMWGYDAILVLGVSGCVFLPIVRIFSRAKIIVNIDGLEHKRDKWNSIAKWFLKFSLSTCIRWSHEVVSDNKGIHDYVAQKYGREAQLIAYGGDHALRNVNDARQKAILEFYGIKQREYDLSICRIEPENNCRLTLDTYAKAKQPIVFIGNWNHSDYSRELYNEYKNVEGFRLLNSIYDLDILYAIRKNARYYVHGHRAGGTNPSLVEAMFFGRPILAFDVIYNRETTQERGYYYKDTETLLDLLKRDDLEGSSTREIAERDYIWPRISRQYESLY